MQQIRNGYRGLSIFMGLNIDRMLSILVIGLAVLMAAWIQSI